jgi:regulator of cell morphogenesis and NO signaling
MYLKYSFRLLCFFQSNGCSREQKHPHRSEIKTMTTETTVGEIVRAVPARSRIFETLGIDYCCGGKKPLAEACQAKGLDPATVVTMLSAMDATPDPSLANPDTLSLSELCDHIEQFHHAYLREELPRLDFMTRKVAAVHGDHEPRLLEVRRVFEAFQAEMSAHTKEEDETIFPAIRQLDSSCGGQTAIAASLKDSFTKLESEHDRAGAALARFKDLTDTYTPPDWACNTFRALYDGLAKLENNTHQHVHKENNLLFPRALAFGGAA